jgi:hypothetical protein
MLSRTTLDFISISERTPQSREIDRELRKLDDRLFLDPEMDPDFDCLVWTVKYHMGAGQAPAWIADWRDPDTRRPLDLSWGLWLMVKRREGRDPFALRDSIRADNERTRTLRAERTHAAYEEIANDIIPRIKSAGHSAVLHRGPHLRRSRERRRSLGLGG